MSEPGTTDLSSVEHFDSVTDSIPERIEAGETEVLPPGEQAEVEQGWPVWDVQQILTFPFYFMGKRYGDFWELDDQEAEKLASAWKPILDRYLPLDDTEWGTALLVALAIMGPRLIQTDWKTDPQNKGKNAPSTPPANTRTAASTGSPVSSANGSPGSPADWEVFSNP